MLPLIEEHLDEVAELCKRYRVQRLDFIVRFDAPGEPFYARRYYQFAEQLQTLFNCPTDVLIDQPFSNPYFRQDVDATRQTVYEINNPKAVI